MFRCGEALEEAMLEPYLLKHFIAVAETLSFTRAAEELNSTQPVVSRTIKRLEEIVGTQLLVRTTRSMSLTPAGEAFLAEVRPAIDRIALATEKARRIGHGPGAKLRLAVCNSVNPLLFAEGLHDFRQRWPEVQLELKPVMGLDQVRLLRSAEIDIGIRHSGGLERLPDIESAVLTREVPVIAVPAIWKMGLTNARLEAFRDTPWIFPDPAVAPSEYSRWLQLCRTAGFEPKVVSTTADNAESALLISTGFGTMLTFRAEGAADTLRGIDFVELDDLSDHYCEISISWSSMAASGVIADFVSSVTGTT
jgi:DNA-binding transcriptional LysR family regulator